MINHRQTNGQTIITLCKYELYNDTQTNGFQENKPPTNHRQTTNKPPTNQNKECKEREEGKEYIIPLSPDGDISLSGQQCSEESQDIPTEENQKKEKSSAKKERKVFTPPSVDEVSRYCKENNYTINPWTFVNHYTSNGWMVGKNKMKDWQAAVRTWQSKENENGNRKLPTSNQFGTSRSVGNSSGNDAANKRAELDDLEKLAEAVLRNTNAPNGG